MSETNNSWWLLYPKLRQLLDDDKAKSLDIAEAEMEAFNKKHEEERNAKRKEVLEKLGLGLGLDKDLPYLPEWLEDLPYLPDWLQDLVNEDLRKVNR